MIRKAKKFYEGYKKTKITLEQLKKANNLKEILNEEEIELFNFNISVYFTHLILELTSIYEKLSGRISFPNDEIR